MIEKTSIKLSFDNGMKDDKQQYKNRSYSNIKTSATDESIKTVAGIINELTSKELLITRKIVTNRIDG